ncbi:hemerythrin domain-containing protein [Pseudomonas sp. G11-1]|uniref:Hemerythrin HHE cation binding domain-containing protein n=1 Tax=Halopseudomonas bauzanensis TaxID=653930 RepID=A0A1H9PY61_9GAMM|nr:hemerythrin domain-containing protein [Halopseudomonas bauzanensis]MCO5785169.1 hemerythrin domain-containing protein [Pseudomonas sp. G11-1]MCO5788727.1 hemerythrin domain-containing protein [Pseudomonas sp. G11-2]SER53080.1 Hemerythrin HHE cation binding domain-containing protein [Halopseudomonas bauzanensis]SFL70178.1 Hemerythrin HHE cation binding domain-containing protein [Halopseudomonas bauzanensis]
MNAIELLKADHETVKQLLEEISATTERAVKKREELLQKIKLELTIHTTIEEEDFYPAFKEAGAKDELKMYHEAKEEHRAVESLVLPDLLNTEPGSVEFSGRIKVLKELLEHHIEEEEQEMFTDAAKLMSKEQLETLGKQMEEKKNNLKKAA